MKLVFTVHSYWPSKDGVQYVTQYLAEGLAKSGHTVVVYVSVNDRKKESIEFHNKVKIIRVYIKSNYSIFVNGKKAFIAQLKNELLDTDCMINCCVQSPINNMILKHLGSIKCKKVLYLHGMHGFKFNKSELKNIKYFAWHIFMNFRWGFFYRNHKKNFNKYNLMIDIHESSEAFSYFMNRGIRVSQTIIHNAVEDFDEDYNTIISVDKGKYFLCVANYVQQKNQKLLLDVFKRIEDTKGFKLVLIGKHSDYSDELKKMIISEKLEDRVILLEDIDRNTTKAYIKNCYCSVMSSQREIYPIFLCESLICGHPYISTNVGCISDIPGGIVVSNEGEFLKAIIYAIDNPEIMKEKANKGSEYARKNFLQSEKIKELENAIVNIKI